MIGNIIVLWLAFSSWTGLCTPEPDRESTTPTRLLQLPQLPTMRLFDSFDPSDIRHLASTNTHFAAKARYYKEQLSRKLLMQIEDIETLSAPQSTDIAQLHQRLYAVMSINHYCANLLPRILKTVEGKTTQLNVAAEEVLDTQCHQVVCAFEQTNVFDREPTTWRHTDLVQGCTSWQGVEFAASKIIRMTVPRFPEGKLTGSLDLTSLPASLQELTLNHNQLTGSLDLTSLPASLQVLYLINNQLTGSLDLTSLPASLQVLNLNTNQLTGSLDLTSLPASLQVLDLGHNQLTGSLDLTSLPASLQKLHLNGNQLTGSLDLTSLPASLQELWLNYNQLTGSVDLTSIPASLQWLELSYNQLTGLGSLDLTSLPASLQWFGFRYGDKAD